MLETYGLHELAWDACDERFGDILVASPADAGGRGISLAVRDGGAAADLTGATVYLAWRHKAAGTRGTEPFEAIDASAGTFSIFYPAAMCEAAGAVQAQVVVSRGDDTYISSRVFTIKVEPVVIGGKESEDGFTLFKEAINAYENATAITTDAAAAANAAAVPADLPMPRFRVAIVRDGSKCWLPWMRGLVDEGGSGDTFAGVPGCGIVDVEFDGGSLGPNGWFTKNMKGDKLIGLTVYYDTPHPEETGYYQAMYRVHCLGSNPGWGKYEHDDDDGGAGNDADQLDMVELTIVRC